MDLTLRHLLQCSLLLVGESSLLRCSMDMNGNNRQRSEEISFITKAAVQITTLLMPAPFTR